MGAETLIAWTDHTPRGIVPGYGDDQGGCRNVASKQGWCAC